MLVGEVVHVRTRGVRQLPVSSVPFLAVNQKKKKQNKKNSKNKFYLKDTFHILFKMFIE